MCKDSYQTLFSSDFSSDTQKPIPSGSGRACESGAGQLSPTARLRRPPACDHHNLSTQATHPSGVATLKLNKAELALLHRPPPSPSQASPASGLS